MKSHLVSNATLSHISGLYNLPAKLKGDPNQLPVLRVQTDVRAAMMEAYIAAIYFSFPVEKRMTEGLPVIDLWLREMYEPLYDFFFTYMSVSFHLTCQLLALMKLPADYHVGKRSTTNIETLLARTQTVLSKLSLMPRWSRSIRHRLAWRHY